MQTSLRRRPSLLLLGIVFFVSCREPRQGGPAVDGGLDTGDSRGPTDSGSDKAGTGGGGPGTGGRGPGTGGTAGSALDSGVAGLGGGGSPGTGGAAGDDGGSSPDGGVTCTAEQKLCSGVCVSTTDPKYGCDPALCDGSSCPDVAGATLVCKSGACVVGTCGTGTKNCGGRCVALTDPAYGCGAATCDATTCPTPGTGGTVICQAEACVIGTCPPDFKKCGTKCVAVSDPTYGCGASTCDATSCPAAGTGTLVCQAGACVVGSCGAGTKKCGDKCVTTDVNNGCADPARCTACASGETCMGTPTACTCVANCAGKCGGSNGCGGTCPNNCATPMTCGGGGTANVCGCTPMCTGKCGGSDGCGGICPNKCVSPQTCGGGGTANVCGCTPNCSGKCGGADSCGGTCPNTCSGTQTCGGGGTANVCGCTPMCTGKCSGSDSCGGTCPNTCTATQKCGGATPNVCCTPACSGKCSGSDSCGGTCPNTCTGAQKCGGATPNVCCNPSASGCGTRACGPVSDGCGGTVNCGPLSGACPAGKTCNGSGACVCPTTYSWPFDANDLSGWSLSAVGASGDIGNAAVAGRSGFPLRIAGASFTDGGITLSVTLCAGAAVTFPTGSFTFRADIRFDSPSGLSFGDDGTGTGSGFPGVLMEGSTLNGDTSFSHLVNGAVNGGGPIPSGMWNTYSFNFGVSSTTPPSYVDLRFVPQAPWTGTIYVDNISIQ